MAKRKNNEKRLEDAAITVGRALGALVRIVESQIVGLRNLSGQKKAVAVSSESRHGAGHSRKRVSGSAKTAVKVKRRAGRGSKKVKDQ